MARNRLFDIGLSVFIGFLAIMISTATPSAFAQTRSTWQTAIVDKGEGTQVGTFSSLVIDKEGGFHISYSNSVGTELRYAFRGRTDKQWYTMVVDRRAGSFDSLAVDSKGRPHISYNSPYLTGLHYASWDGKNWDKIIIDPERTNHYTSIQLDSHDQPRISYYREEYPDQRNALYLKYAYFDGKAWYIQTVDRRFGTGKWNSLALDRTDRPYIAYSIVGSGDLGFAYLEESKWKIGVADARRSNGNNYVGNDNTIVLDSSGAPHVAYLDGTRRAMKYAWREGNNWSVETVDLLAAIPSEADRFSLKLDSHGQPHVAYYDAGAGALKYASRDAKGWHTEVVGDGNVGEFPSLCFADNDEPYISYYAVVSGQLRIAHPPAIQGKRPVVTVWTSP
jgi:hypothetical protein